MTRTHGHYFDRILAHDLKFMCSEYGWFMMHGYDDMIDNVILQNGV